VPLRGLVHEHVVAAVGLGLLAYELVFTFAQGWEHPTDFPDVALTGLWLWAAMAGRRWGLLAVALGAAFNRESAAFAGVLWLVLYGFTVRWTARLSELAFGILIVTLVVAGSLLIMTNLNQNMMLPAELMDLHMQH